MYSSALSQRGDTAEPLPQLRAPKEWDGTGSSFAPLDGSYGGGETGAAPRRTEASFGRAWSPPASLNGTLTGLTSVNGAAPSVGEKRQFVYSSSAPAASQQSTPAASITRSVSPATPAISARAAASLDRLGAPTSRKPPFATGATAYQDGGSSVNRPSAGAAEDDTSGDATQCWQAKPAGSSQQPAAAPLSRSNASAPKSERIADVDRFLTKHAASYVAEPQRNANVRRALEDVARVYPALSPITLQVNRYVKEVGAALLNAQANQAKELERRERELYEKFERFFEEKLCTVLREKAALERTAAQLHQENFALRQERDGELSDLKVDLMKRLNECEKREDEFRSFRQLIAAVFQTNEKLSNRVEDLELKLAQHGIEVPPADEDVFRFSKSSVAQKDREGGNGDGGGYGGNTRGGRGDRGRFDEAMGRVGTLPPAFMQASKEELHMARLTLQEELLHCAFDDRSAYRLQISGLKNENNNLKYELSALTTTVEQLNRYIHEKRFLAPTYDDDGQVVRPMTPRPSDVPFGIETELGIDLKCSTSHIVSELAAVATNLKHQLNSALLRLRQATTVSDWMTEETLLELDSERHGDAAGLLPTFPVQAWPSIPHFLRTTISPDVDNFRWSPSDIAAVLLTFFRRYAELRAACRYVRDSKMMAPRVYQQFERREVVLTPLDASKDDVSKDENAVPFGYVVTEFIRSLLMRLTPGSREAALALPGTLHPRFTVRGEEKVVELEFTRFAYNIWWAAQRHRRTQPLCRLFLDVVNGRLPVGVFEKTEAVLAGVVRYVHSKLDLDGSHTFTYQRLVGGVARLVADMGANATRCGVLAVVQTFEENQVPIMGGRVRLDALLADETCCVPEARLGTDEPTPAVTASSGAAAGGARVNAVGNLPPTITVKRVPGWQLQPLGASVFVRYWRRLVLERYERVYSFVERAMAPLAVESDVVLGLYLLPVPEALARAGCFDSDVDAKAADFGAQSTLFFPDDSALKVPIAMTGTSAAGAATNAPRWPGTDPIGDHSDDSTNEASDGGSTVVAEAYESASRAVPEVTKNYEALLKHRRGVVRSRQASEGLLLAAIVRDVLEGLPTLNRSVHFPFHANSSEDGDTGSVKRAARATPASATAAEGGSAASKPSKKAKSSKGKRRDGAAKKTAEAAAGQQRRDVGDADLPRVGEGATAVTAAPAAPAKPKTKNRAKASRPRAVVPSEMVTVPDRELVEWYGFCFALRQRTLQFTEQIFQRSFLDPQHAAEATSPRGANVDAGTPSSCSDDEKPFAEHFDTTAHEEPSTLLLEDRSGVGHEGAAHPEEPNVEGQ